MTWLAPDLDQRVQIGSPIQESNEAGGADFSFDTLLTVWMELKPITFKGAGSEYIRGEQINEAITHEFKVRSIAVAQLGSEYGSGFSIAFKSMPNLKALKSDYFLFVQRGPTVKGRLFRIHGVTDNKEQREFLRITAEEIEERGTGWQV